MKIVVISGVVMLALAGTVTFALLIAAYRGEESGVPEEPLPDVSREDQVSAMLVALSSKAEVDRRLDRILRSEKPLVKHLEQTAHLYVPEVGQ